MPSPLGNLPLEGFPLGYGHMDASRQAVFGPNHLQNKNHNRENAHHEQRYSASDAGFETKAQGVNKVPDRIGRELGKTFANHRFDKDLTDLASNRTQYFKPHADVTFYMSDVKHSICCGIEPLEGAYQGVVWKFKIELPQSYPFQPPKILAISPTFHPNIEEESGMVALRLLREDWSPVLTLRIVVLGLVLLFVEPNLDVVVNGTAAFLLQNDFQQYLNRIAVCRTEIHSSMEKDDLLNFRPKRRANCGPADAQVEKRRLLFPKDGGGRRANCSTKPAPYHHTATKPPAQEVGAQRVLVQKLTHCTLSRSSSNKRRKLFYT
mmetsp:Transcript_6202/g.9770  ORF Transcript_6202/g.9770 Transcript_6202/m.9770 type:complete len:321 (+) Transcript_6202:175-1137(+)